MAKVALLIGVSEYEPGLNPLPSAARDVEAMQQVLQNPDIGGFMESDITVLINQPRQDIENAIYRLFANRQRDDVLLLYFSGHGLVDDEGEFYLSTRFTLKDGGNLITPTAVASSYIHRMMNGSRSRRQIVILDCCFSGAFAKGMTAKDTNQVDVRRQLGGEGRAILTASTSTQYAFEQEAFALSIYTHFLVEGLQTGAADRDNDGMISVDELHEYVRSKVREAAPKMTPEFYPVREGHTILLATSPKDDPKLKYRKEAEQRAAQGTFSVFARRLLDSKRQEWGLSPAEAEAIETEVLRPYREYERKLKEYEDALIEAVKAEFPFGESTAQDLQDYRQYLALKDNDADAIEARILPAEVPSEQTESLPRGDDLRLDLKLDLREAAFGGEKEIRISHLETCSTCKGSGTKPGKQSQVCPTCKGKGRTQEAKRLKIAVPAGVDTGTRLRVASEGDAGQYGGSPGDLYVYLFVNEDPDFQRDGIDILSEVRITRQQASSGNRLNIKTIDGSGVLTIPPNTKDGTVLRLKNRGVPRLGNPSERGNHLITVKVLS